MDFNFSTYQLSLKAKATEFGKTLNKDVYKYDEEKVFPLEKWNLCREQNLFGLQIPEKFGGREYEMLTAALVLEGFGYGCKDNGLAFTLNGQMVIQLPIILCGTEHQKQHYLPRMATGERLGAFAFTEPESGSDLYSIRTTAVKERNAYRINGKKTYISFAPIAEFAIVFATVNTKLKEWGLSAFLVDLTTEGITVGQPQNKMGLRTVPAGDIEFNNCLVNEKNLLGNEGSGTGIIQQAIELERCLALASQIGAMERQLEECIDYARTRKQFGKRIGDFQSISNRIADMKLRLEGARLLTYKAIHTREQGRSSMLDSALAKLSLSESFVESSLDAIRIHGGASYFGYSDFERNLRDAVGGVIYGGTSDIQRNTISRLLGL